jgi:hypothetical protein
MAWTAEGQVIPGVTTERATAFVVLQATFGRHDIECPLVGDSVATRC